MLRFVIAVLFATVANAQTLEIIPLKYRMADQVLDTLRPLVEPGGTLTGQGNQLILRVSPANLAELRRALDAIDRPARRLQVSVRFDNAFEDARRTAQERVDQRLQVLEGGRATIYAGRLRPTRDTLTGFEVVPRIVGHLVTLEIYASRAGSTSAASTVSGPLGEWFELGSVASDAGNRRVSVKVDPVDLR